MAITRIRALFKQATVKGGKYVILQLEDTQQESAFDDETGEVLYD